MRPGLKPQNTARAGGDRDESRAGSGRGGAVRAGRGADPRRGCAARESSRDSRAGAGRSEELAAELGTERRATELLVEALAGLGYLTVVERRLHAHQAGPQVARPRVRDIHRHLHREHRRLRRLVDAARGGRSAPATASRSTSSRPIIRIGAATSGAVRAGAAVGRRGGRKLRVPAQPQSLLDIAGGHGWYAAALCKKHPTLRARVLDLEPSARVGREIIAEHGLSDRVEHEVGDLFTSDWADRTTSC